MRSALTFVAAAAIGLVTASAVSAAELIRVGNAGRDRSALLAATAIAFLPLRLCRRS